MFNKIKNLAMQSGYRLLRAKGANCPECKYKLNLPAQIPDDGMDTMLTCSQCGWSDSLSGLFSLTRGDHLSAKTTKPDGCKILESVEMGTHTWLIPAKKRLNFLMFFSAFWLFATGFVVIGSLFGKVTDTSTGESVTGWGYLFFMPFLLVGLIAAYIGLRLAFTELILRVDGDKITLLRRFFGRVWGEEYRDAGFWWGLSG